MRAFLRQGPWIDDPANRRGGVGPLPKDPQRKFEVGDKIRVNLHHGKIEDAVVRAVPQDADGIKLQVDVVGLASRR